MSDALGMMIECLVAILLMLTIGYCMMLNRRLKLLRADEDALRATIAELITATEIAERAIAGLKAAAHDCETGLGERLGRAEILNTELDRKLAAGKHVVGDLIQIATAGRRATQNQHVQQQAQHPVPSQPSAPAAAPLQDAKAIAAAAQA
ncbi:MAG TPA: DUF6468 domain-containing protein, partial [Bradyrhizobium sp.]|nr:DUF6468 domain-containing protein [Bradyrhizobium sp.]